MNTRFNLLARIENGTDADGAECAKIICTLPNSATVTLNVPIEDPQFLNLLKSPYIYGVFEEEEPNLFGFFGLVPSDEELPYMNTPTN